MDERSQYRRIRSIYRRGVARDTVRVFTETDGGHVLFDAFRWPLLRKRVCSFVILPADAPVRFVSERALYDDFDASDSMASAIHALLMVERYGLREEVKRRDKVGRTVGFPSERLFACSPPDAPAVMVG